MSRLDEVNERLDEKYGDSWGGYDITEDEAREWLDACYEHYENDCELRETFGGYDTEDDAFGLGRPFNIVRHVDYDDEEYDFADKPLWIIDIDGQHRPAYPDEIFYD